ncbi:MAG: PEP-CTERM sorting domain-containing protein [Phycisphaerae bacterium]
MVRVVSVLACLAVVSSATAAPINYRENWDSYAAGRDDPAYVAVWACTDETDRPIIQASNAASAPNAIGLELKNRFLVNSLVDGVTNGTVAGTEMNAGEVVKPGQAALGDASNLIMEYRMGFGANAQRAATATWMEVSFGTQHAPTSGLTSGTPIPVLAIGKLNAKVDSTAGNNQPYFFNGLNWFRCGNSTFSGTGRDQQLLVTVYYDTDLAAWQAQVTLTGGLYNGTNVFALAFDPTVLGFNTVSWAQWNSGSAWSGATPTGDDVALSGGMIVPEPATLLVLALGGLPLLRRRGC